LINEEVLAQVEQEVVTGLVADTEGDKELDKFGELVED